MDAYSTDYYDISYPGLIMKVTLIILKLDWEQKQNMTCLGLKNKSELNLCLQIVNSGGSLSMTAMFS